MLLAPVFRGGRPTLCSDEVFVTTYMEKFRAQKTRWDVAEALGYGSATAIDMRANAMRRRGVQLPYFSQKSSYASTAKLNSIVFGG